MPYDAENYAEPANPRATAYLSCKEKLEADAAKFLAELSAVSAKYGLVLVGEDVRICVDPYADVGCYALVGGDVNGSAGLAVMSDQSPHCDDLATALPPKPFEDKLSALGKTPTSRRIVRACDGLGPNALTILAEIAERLQRGRAQYNDDFDKPRDWAQETFEELADGLVYSTMKLQELRTQREADAQRQAAALRLDDETLRMRDHSRLDPRDGAAPAPIVCDFPLGPERCRCIVCNPPHREDWEKTRDGCG